MSSGGRGRGFRQDGEVPLRKPGQNQKEAPPVEHYEEVKTMIEKFTDDYLGEKRFVYEFNKIVEKMDDDTLEKFHKAIFSLALINEHFAIKYTKTIVKHILRKNRDLTETTVTRLKKVLLNDLQAVFEEYAPMVKLPDVTLNMETKIKMIVYILAKYLNTSRSPKLFGYISNSYLSILEYFARTKKLDAFVIVPVSYLLLMDYLRGECEELMNLMRDISISDCQHEIRILSLFTLDLHAYGGETGFPIGLRQFYEKFESTASIQKLQFFLDKDVDWFVKSPPNMPDCGLKVEKLEISKPKQDDQVQRKEGQVPRAILGSRSK